MTQLYPSEDTAQGYRRLEYRSVLMYARMENLKQVHVPHTDTHACMPHSALFMWSMPAWILTTGTCRQRDPPPSW